jgi:hypothetical protein
MEIIERVAAQRILAHSHICGTGAAVMNSSKSIADSTITAMFVLVDERRPEDSQWPLMFMTKLMPVDGGEEPKLVLSIRGPSLLVLLNLIYMYASVDTCTVLPVLLLFNVWALQSTMEELGWT